MGRAILDAEFKHFGRSYTEAQFVEVCTAVGSRTGFMNVEDLYNTLGYGGLAISKIALKLRDEFDRVVKPEEAPAAPIDVSDVQISKKPKNVKSNGGVVVDGESGCTVKFAKCCNPLPGDDIIGFITKGYGISIHKRDCPNVKEGMKDLEHANRWVTVEWESNADSSGDGSVYEALVRIIADNTISLIANITTTLFDMRVSILQINSTTRSDNTIIIDVKVGCKNIDHYNSIVSRLSSLKDIKNVSRGFS
jgi:GTP pyrophosphokinase